MKQQLKTAALGIAILAAILTAYQLAANDYKCLPYTPKDECELSRYEVRIHDVTERSKRLIGMAEGACVYTIGHGKAKRIVMHDAEFTAANRTDYFEKVEFPATQTTICEVR